MWIILFLAVVHALPMSVIILPFTWDVSPLDVLREWRDFLEMWIFFALALPLLLPLILVYGQIRAIVRKQWTTIETSVTWLCVFGTACAVPVVLVAIAWEGGPYYFEVFEMIAVGILVCGMFVLFPGRLLMWWLRPLRRQVALLFWARAVFILHVIFLVTMFFDEWDSGAWISLGAAALYTAECATFLAVGTMRTRPTRARLLRFWLPLADVPHVDGLTCLTCGYDLRGTVPLGRKVCPECGTPTAAME